MSKDVVIQTERLGQNTDGEEDVLVAEMMYVKGRGYRLNVFVQQETSYDGVRMVSRTFGVGQRVSTDISVLVQEAGRFNAKTLSKLAEAEKGSDRLSNMIAQVRAAYEEKRKS